MAGSQQVTPNDALDRGAHDRWFILTLLFLNYFTLYAHRNLINYIQKPLLDELELTELQLSIIAWAFQITYAVSQIFVSYLSDRFRRRNVLLVSLTLSTTTLACMGLAQGFYDLAAMRVLLAAFQAASIPAIAGIMADCFTQRNRSRAVSIYLLSSPFSLVAAGAIGGAIADGTGGWRATMFVFGGMGYVVVAVLFLLLREPERTERSDAGLGTEGASLGQTLKTVLSVPSFLLVIVVFILASSVVQQLDFFVPRYFSDHFKMNLKESGVMATVAPQIGTVIGILTGGVLADRLAQRWMSGRFQVQIVGIALAVPAVFTIASVDSKPVILVAMLVYGIGFWLYLSNLWTTTFEVVDPAARSTAVGLLNVGAGLLGSWPYLVVGELRDRGIITDLRIVFFGHACALCFAVIALVFLVTVTLKRDYRTTAKIPDESN